MAAMEEEAFTFDLTTTDPVADDDDDRVYEDIEAPKFVDLTAPDRYLPEDGSWFCNRIGCDQNHDEADPEELHRSFVLRVLAARSPNIRLQKALKGRSAIPKCPRTAPVKSAKAGIQKLAAIDSVPDKAAISKLKTHPISALRSTPLVKLTAEPSSAVSKCLTTPRLKKGVSFADPFRSTKIPKVSAPMATNRAVARSLAFLSPSKVQKSQTSVAEMCSGIEKLQIGSKPKHVSRHLCKCLNGAPAVHMTPKSAVPPQSRLRVPAARLKNRDQQTLENTGQKDSHTLSHGACCDHNSMDVDGKARSSIEGYTCKDGADEALNSNDFQEEEVSGKDIVPEEKVSNFDDKEGNNITDNSMASDDDKENTSSTPISRSTNAEKENINVPINSTAKSASAPAKPSNNRDIQGALRKLKYTNPKPFRLRTDERGVLREANFEKRAQLNVLGEIKPYTVKPERSRGGEKADLVPQRRKRWENGKDETTQRKMLKLDLWGHGNFQSDSSESGNGNNVSRALPQGGTPNKSATRPQVKKPITVPRAPVFHRIHVPKGCTKRLQNCT